MAKKQSGLGKGLGALMLENTTEDMVATNTLPISEIIPNKEQPRKTFDEDALAELAESIKQHGVLQPLLVRPLPSGGYQLVAGERRWRASRMAKLREVPVVVKELTDTETMEIAIIENLQREDLNPIEEAEGLQALIDKCGFTQEEVAASVGKSRSAIANSLRLLRLPQEVRDMTREGSISAGHARALYKEPWKKEGRDMLKYWVWLAELPRLKGPFRLALLRHFGSPEDIFFADREELLLAEDVPPGQAELALNRDLSAADRILADCQRLGQRILTIQDAEYPQRLRNIFDPPLVLYVKGRMPAVDEEAAIAVVGTRECA